MYVLPFSASVCHVYAAVNTLTVSAELLVEAYLPFLVVTNSATRSQSYGCLARHMKVMDESFPLPGRGAELN